MMRRILIATIALSLSIGASSQTICSDTCTGSEQDTDIEFALAQFLLSNSYCDDGGPGAAHTPYSGYCDYGTDCTDCGPRAPLPSPSPPPSSQTGVCSTTNCGACFDHYNTPPQTCILYGGGCHVAAGGGWSGCSCESTSWIGPVLNGAGNMNVCPPPDPPTPPSPPPPPPLPPSPPPELPARETASPRAVAAANKAARAAERARQREEMEQAERLAREEAVAVAELTALGITLLPPPAAPPARSAVAAVAGGGGLAMLPALHAGVQGESGAGDDASGGAVRGAAAVGAVALLLVAAEAWRCQARRREKGGSGGAPSDRRGSRRTHRIPQEEDLELEAAVPAPRRQQRLPGRARR